MELYLLTGLILGLSSNLHCIGMCGPIAMAIPVNRSSNLSLLMGTLQYNFGRIFTYAVLGAIVGSLGLSINTIGILQWLSIITGIALIFFAWRKYFSNSIKIPGLNIQSFLNKSLGKVIRSKSPFKLLLLGALNGLLPCGMVFVALSNALLTGNIGYSALAMVAFGVATLPAMITVTYLANKISGNARKKLTRFVPYMLTLVGLLIILRGMNLDIPYISPKVNVKQEVNTSTEEANATVEMSCCHSSSDCD